MNLIYVGDASNLSKRVRSNHCGGNVEGSAFRKHVAEAIGFRLSRTRRTGGSIRTRLDLPDPRQGERVITTYGRSGYWRVIECDNPQEAEAFQWFAIKHLNPLLNRDRRDWDRSRESRFLKLIEEMQSGPFLGWEQTKALSTGPGVYAFYHASIPQPLTISE